MTNPRSGPSAKQLLHSGMFHQATVNTPAFQIRKVDVFGICSHVRLFTAFRCVSNFSVTAFVKRSTQHVLHSTRRCCGCHDVFTPPSLFLEPLFFCVLAINADACACVCQSHQKWKMWKPETRKKDHTCAALFGTSSPLSSSSLVLACPPSLPPSRCCPLWGTRAWIQCAPLCSVKTSMTVHTQSALDTDTRTRTLTLFLFHLSSLLTLNFFLGAARGNRKNATKPSFYPKTLCMNLF